MAMSSPGMTSADSFKTQSTPFDHSMLQNRLFHVLTTGRSKATARRKQWRNNILINQNRKYGYLSQVGCQHLFYLLV